MDAGKLPHGGRNSLVFALALLQAACARPTRELPRHPRPTAADTFESSSAVHASPGGVQVAGLDGRNDLIYDNDDYGDILDDLYVAGKAKLGVANLKGWVVSADTGDRRGFAHWKGKWDSFRAKATADGLAIPEALDGAQEPFYERGASLPPHPMPILAPGDARVRKYAGTPAVRFIIETVRSSSNVSPRHPLVYMAGGQATTVAAALLLAPDIRDKIVVLHCDPRATNSNDGYALYVVSKVSRLISYDFQFDKGISRAQQIALKADLQKAVVDWKHDQPYYDVNGVGDGLLVVWYFNNHLIRSTAAFRHVNASTKDGPSHNKGAVKFVFPGWPDADSGVGAASWFHLDGTEVDVDGVGNEILTFLRTPGLWAAGERGRGAR